MKKQKNWGIAAILTTVLLLGMFVACENTLDEDDSMWTFTNLSSYTITITPKYATSAVSEELPPKKGWCLITWKDRGRDYYNFDYNHYWDVYCNKDSSRKEFTFTDRW